MAELVYRPVIGLASVLFRVLDLPIEMSGLEHVPDTGGAVLAINHVSYVDFIFSGLTGVRARPRRLVRFMAKEAVFSHPVSGPLMRGMHHIPVDRAAGASALATAVSALRAGEVVGVFPEATISRAYQLKDFKSGAARMAVEAAVPLIPVVTWGGQRLLPKGRRPQLARHIPVKVVVGAPLPYEAGADPVVVTKELREVMAGMLDSVQSAYPDRPADDADRWWLPQSMGGTAPTLAEAATLDNADAEGRRQARLEWVREQRAERERRIAAGEPWPPPRKPGWRGRVERSVARLRPAGGRVRGRAGRGRPGASTAGRRGTGTGTSTSGETGGGTGTGEDRSRS